MYHLVRDPVVDRAAGSTQARTGVNKISAVVRRHIKWCAGLAMLPVLAACGGDGHHHHDGGGAPQVAQQVTLGLAASNFLSTDQTQKQILGTSTVQQAVAGLRRPADDVPRWQ
jgi:hypothetical protein